VSVVALADAKLHLNVTKDTDDLELQWMLDSAEAAITQLIGPLGPLSVTSSIDGRAGVVNFPDSWDGRSLVLPIQPVISVTTLTGSSGATVDPSLLRVTSGGVVYYADGFSRFNEIFYTVTYQAGRVAPLSADLQLAVKELLRHLWETQRGAANRSGGAVGDSLASTLPGAAYTFPIRIEQLLTPYMQVDL
jgi:hypothetical protein